MMKLFTDVDVVKCSFRYGNMLCDSFNLLFCCMVAFGFEVELMHDKGSAVQCEMADKTKTPH